MRLPVVFVVIKARSTSEFLIVLKSMKFGHLRVISAITFIPIDGMFPRGLTHARCLYASRINLYFDSRNVYISLFSSILQRIFDPN